ncbi:MAG TPA: hypothetical protein VHL34_19680 [Rhizomicrobium sp.]|jgi:hypothetical protein|nr:hypothetical protein [Rhizomicrobium sp.]
MAGYSPKSLPDKLGIKPNTTIIALGAPKDYATLIAPLPSGAIIAAKPPKTGAPFVHLFVTSIAELDKHLPLARKAMTQDGMLWVSWYKKAAKIPTDVTEGVIRARALKTDLVDVKVCAVSELWSGLKLVVRKALR